MDKFEIVILTLGVSFLLWKFWFWLSWEIEKKIFFQSVRHFLEKSEESSKEKRSTTREGK